MARGLTQRELAERSGISLGTIRRLERGELSNPGIRYLTNIAIALDLDGPFDVCEAEWQAWTNFSGAAG
jgi:transcriptional regulator with XRE-family HTH domain